MRGLLLHRPSSTSEVGSVLQLCSSTGHPKLYRTPELERRLPILAAFDMEGWTFDPPPPGLRPRDPGGISRAGDGDEGPSSTSSSPAADGTCTQPTSGSLQPDIISAQHSPKGTGSTNTYQLEKTLDLGFTIISGVASQRSDLQLERDLNDPSHSGCDSCKDFHQIHDALAQTKSLPTGSGYSNSSEQLEEDYIDHFPNGCASCKVFNEIQDALALIQLLPPGSVQSKTLRLNGSLVQPIPTARGVHTFHENQKSPVEVSSAAPGPANSTYQLEEFRWNSPWIFPCNLSRVTKFLLHLRKRIGLLSISVFIAIECFRMLPVHQICV